MKTPLNVLQFICPTGFYGAERWILALAGHLDPQKVRSSLAVTSETASKDLQLVREFKERELGDIVELSMSHRFDPQVINRLAEFITSQKIDIIHTHGYKSDVIGVLAARRAGILCISTPHGFENARDLKLRLFIKLGCMAMKRADAVVPLSEALLEDCRHLQVPDERLFFIRNGVDLSEVENERQKPRQLSGKKRIGFIGQLISRKNVDDILMIFDQLRREREDIELVIVGDGDERERLETLSSQLSSVDDVHFLGFRDDRLALLHSFDIFTMTSTLEGIPRCLMEAAAMGIPIAAYDIPGVDQLVSHNETGLLAPLGDRETLLSHWRRLLNDGALAQQLSATARENVNAHYAASRMAEQYTDLFQRLYDQQGTTKLPSQHKENTTDVR
ncbi:glycosyltransferase family 4 protein [Congregibacter variabilis]|uniref:Glycosyltransferase family 4 protein n=1 Tax=Congregibacter variabilis TaxID=3081200 RepID=A0ABZ0I9B9_9GAMM|nr:glycosyltransferase family 4 protein [Congregibacter sp. IMCC43200]